MAEICNGKILLFEIREFDVARGGPGSHSSGRLSYSFAPFTKEVDIMMILS